jgi:hypothetical protein
MHPEKLAVMAETNILNYFISPDLKSLGEELKMFATGPGNFDAVEFISRLDSGVLRERLLRKVIDESSYDEKVLDRLLADTVKQIKRRWYREIKKILMIKMNKAQEAGDMNLCNELLNEKERLLKEERTQVL